MTRNMAQCGPVDDGRRRLGRAPTLRVPPAPAQAITYAASDDDVLRYVVRWVKENRGDHADLVTDVSSILMMLGLPEMSVRTTDEEGYA